MSAEQESKEAFNAYELKIGPSTATSPPEVTPTESLARERNKSFNHFLQENVLTVTSK